MKNLFFFCSLLTFFQFSSIFAADTPAHLTLARADNLSTHSAESGLWNQLNPDNLKLRSAAALVVDQSGRPIYAKQVDTPRPIASITKLMTAMVILDSALDLQEKITITKDDRDLLRLTGSRLKYGATLTREELIRLALMASEYRASNALARTYPDGTEGLVEAMKDNAGALGMHDSRFAVPAGQGASDSLLLHALPGCHRQHAASLS